MHACIFESSMSILVNGSPTDDFKVGRGLHQGDPLSPFLFLILAEGLTGLMRKVVELGKFRGYCLNDSILFQILQFADHTILKSKFYGLNVDSRLLEAASCFLSCRSEVIPFKFLGIPVGANPRRRETWKSVVDAMTKRYGHLPTQLMGLMGMESYLTGTKHSIWWKDVISRGSGFEDDWFKLNDVLIAERLIANDNNFMWSGQWAEQLTENEEQQLEELKGLLVGFSLLPNSTDCWCWALGNNGCFTVKSCYDWLLQYRQDEELNGNVLAAIKQLWKNEVPTKVSIFGWRIILDRLPTRMALNRRGILLNPIDLNCILCLQH
ncbi:hypothetical protein TSUD_375990 [Trifolium subterraneum]|uniref:Reverse transcriptase zinc-binding domain-containing protein n=1 Tax=Trifolium subterraneum TaxID=3900 RepID=A0A2Z6M0U6_TRISU|nr:hypothetical protein TSUD_375990 [Trifolium subterraneum]